MDMNVSDSSIKLSRRELDAFATRGYLGPKSLLTRNQTALLMRYLRCGQHPAPTTVGDQQQVVVAPPAR